jgi:hypothetical protein
VDGSLTAHTLKERTSQAGSTHPPFPMSATKLQAALRKGLLPEF